MEEDLEKIRQCTAVAEANIVNGVRNPHVRYFEVLLKQGFMFADGMYKGQTVAMFDTYQDWLDTQVFTLERFRETERSKQMTKVILGVIGLIIFIVAFSI